MADTEWSSVPWKERARDFFITVGLEWVYLLATGCSWRSGHFPGSLYLRTEKENFPQRAPAGTC